ncbi:hypothetical protein ANO14919_074900 [Xylariales sp. No.14919]|nr:hypothetical protein ANO14919_074900 [Xylariales sp. No.14919]
MKPTHSAFGLLFSFLAGSVDAQQFNDTFMGIDYPGVSPACVSALNTTVLGCPSFLISISVDNPRLNSEQLSSLCTSGCRSSLEDTRKIIASACNQTSDVFTLNHVTWPVTYIIDRFLFTQTLSCRKDSASGEFCDELHHEWLANGSTSAQNCSDCMLGTIQDQLNSPFGYHAEFAADFQSLTLSCNVTGYTFTSPTPYPSTLIPVEATHAPVCSDPYVVKSGESCDSIAVSLNVSTYSIIKAGGLDPGCGNLSPGDSLCLPAPCQLYRVQYDDTCGSIIAAHGGLNAVDILTWNANINTLCTNLDSLVGTLLCVSAPGNCFGNATMTTAPPTPAAATITPVPKPTNGANDSNGRCASWYTVRDGDYCWSVSIRQSITLRDFYFLNPSIDANCTNLLLGVAYCVRPVGDINSYSAYPYSTSPLYTLTPFTYVTTTLTMPVRSLSMTPLIPLPTAPGTILDCAEYVEFVPVPPVADQNIQPDVPVITESINSCYFALTAFGVSMEDFISWNPSLSSISPCQLQEGYSYCALNSSGYALPSNSMGSLCLNVTSVYPGTIPSCSCFTLVMGYNVGMRSCQDIALDSNITTQQLVNWNPWVGSDCDTGIYSGLLANATRAICIGTNLTDFPLNVTNSTALLTTNSTSLPPTQTGIIGNCSEYYTAKEGDVCWTIAKEYNITLDRFYAWNPAVGLVCENLLIGYAYCVAVTVPTNISTPATSASVASIFK